MRTVLAAIDSSPACQPVLATAGEMARLSRSRAVAVHVRAGDGSATPEALARRAGLPLRVLEGVVEDRLLETVAEADVVMAVVGARATPAGRRPVGHTAHALLARTSKPVVVVPPDAPRAAPFTRVLVPLEGTDASSGPVMDCLADLLPGHLSLVVLHVFTPETLPRMIDRPEDLDILGAEFLARHLPPAVRVEFRSGAVDHRVAEVCEEEDADLVVLSWSQDSTGGKAAVVRGVLGYAKVPVLLLPGAPGSCG